MTDRQSLSIIAPVFNEEDVVQQFYTSLVEALEPLSMDVEMVFVDDGSTDGSLRLLSKLQEVDSRINIIELSRNFGKEAAVTAGLDHCSGDAAIIIDVDLQDPPSLIPTLVDKWREGLDVVYAQRTERQGDSWLKKSTAKWFYNLMKKIGPVRIPENTGDFRLMSRQAINALSELRETHRFMKGLFTWIGYSQTAVHYKREPRYGGETKWHYWALWNFAIDGITSFTIAPLKIASYLGLVVALFAFLFGLYIIADTILYGNPVEGYPSLMVIVLFLGAVQLMAIGILGEYVGRIFNETKKRPIYIVKKFHTGGTDRSSSVT